MKKRALSVSQVNKYSKCPRSYKYHYVDGIREKTVTSYLVFGSAMDAALNAMLLDFKANKSVTIDYKKVFDDNWQHVEINKVKHPLPECTLVGYAKADFDVHLLTKDDKRFIRAKATEYKLKHDLSDLGMLKQELENRRSNRSLYPFLEPEHKILNLMNWLSVRRKAFVLLDAYVRDIIPELDEVVDVQKKVSMTSDNGDEFIGFIDAVVKFKGSSHTYILDNKTSASPFNSDKIRTNSQLATYAFMLGLNHGSFAVMIKNIRMNKEKTCSVCGYKADDGARHKTCTNTVDGARCNGEWEIKSNPEGVTQLLKDEIDNHLQEAVAETLADVLFATQQGIFPRNLEACNDYYGGVCPMMGICLYGKKESDHLIKVES